MEPLPWHQPVLLVPHYLKNKVQTPKYRTKSQPHLCCCSCLGWLCGQSDPVQLDGSTLFTLSFFLCKMGTVIEWGSPPKKEWVSHMLMAHLSTVLPDGGRPYGLNFSGCFPAESDSGVS